jgi:hypothetical protein
LFTGDKLVRSQRNQVQKRPRAGGDSIWLVPISASHDRARPSFERDPGPSESAASQTLRSPRGKYIKTGTTEERRRSALQRVKDGPAPCARSATASASMSHSPTSTPSAPQRLGSLLRPALRSRGRKSLHHQFRRFFSNDQFPSRSAGVFRCRLSPFDGQTYTETYTLRTVGWCQHSANSAGILPRGSHTWAHRSEAVGRMRRPRGERRLLDEVVCITNAGRRRHGMLRVLHED